MQIFYLRIGITMHRCLLLLTLVGTLTFVGCDQRTPQQKMVDFIQEESKNLPQRVNEFTTLVELKAKPSEIVYIYEVNGLTDDEVLDNQEEIESTVRAGLVGKKKALEPQIRDRIKMTYVYTGSSKTELFQFTVNTWTL